MPLLPKEKTMSDLIVEWDTIQANRDVFSLVLERHTLLIPFHECWEWNGGRHRSGHGRFRIRAFGKRAWQAHRVSYQLTVGRIPYGLAIDHICRNTGCVRPNHLRPLTLGENTVSSPNTVTGINARKTHCCRGHSLMGENLFVDLLGKRNCRICRRFSALRYYYRTRKVRKPRLHAMKEREAVPKKGDLRTTGLGEAFGMGETGRVKGE